MSLNLPKELKNTQKTGVRDDPVFVIVTVKSNGTKPVKKRQAEKDGRCQNHLINRKVKMALNDTNNSTCDSHHLFWLA